MRVDTLLKQVQSLQRRQKANVFPYLAIFVLVLIVYYLIVATLLLYAGWESGDWSFIDFGVMAWSIILGIFALVIIIVLVVQRLRARRGSISPVLLAQAVGDAMKSTDDAIMPLIPTPAVPQSDNMKGVIRPFKKMLSIHIRPSAIYMVFIAIYLIIVTADFLVTSIRVFFIFPQHAVAGTLYPPFSPLFSGSTLYSDPILVISLVQVLLSFIWLFYILAINIGKDRSAVQFDAMGLRVWTIGRRARSIPWQDVRLIGMVKESDSQPGQKIRHFMIASERDYLSWQLPANPTARQRDATDQLLAIAASRTGLPIRDLTGIVTALAEADRRTLDALSSDPVEARAARVLYAAQLPGSRIAPSRRALAASLAVIAVIAVIAPVILGDYIQQQMQPAYFAGLFGEITAQTPIFTDSLAEPSGKWITIPQTNLDTGKSAYANGGLTLSGGAWDDPVMAVNQRILSDVAVQVTVSEQNAITNSTLSTNDGQPYSNFTDGAGIVVNVDPANPHGESCEFTIRTDGTWGFDCGFSTPFYQGRCSAIHTGPGAINTIMLVSRGVTTLQYINGQLVGWFSDEFDSIGTAGQIGLMNNLRDGSAAIFSNLTVWPVQPLPSLSWV